MEYELKNINGDVICTAVIEPAETDLGNKSRAILWAVTNGVSLADAHIPDVDLTGEDLSGGIFSGADMSAAILDDVDYDGNVPAFA